MSKRAKDDLESGKIILAKGEAGNQNEFLTFRAPDIVYMCDVSEYGYE